MSGPFGDHFQSALKRRSPPPPYKTNEKKKNEERNQERTPPLENFNGAKERMLELGASMPNQTEPNRSEPSQTKRNEGKAGHLGTFS